MAGLFDLCESTGLDTTQADKDYKFDFLLDPNKWNDFRLSRPFNLDDWKFIRYQNAKGTESSDYKEITEAHGGVFIWLIQPKRIPINVYSYIAYIGMSENNLKNTLCNFKRIAQKNTTDRLSQMLFDDYASNLSVVYYESDDRAYNMELLNKLSEAIQPPIKEIPISIETQREDF